MLGLLANEKSLGVFALKFDPNFNLIEIVSLKSGPKLFH